VAELGSLGCTSVGRSRHAVYTISFRPRTAVKSYAAALWFYLVCGNTGSDDFRKRFIISPNTMAHASRTAHVLGGTSVGLTAGLMLYWVVRVIRRFDQVPNGSRDEPSVIERIAEG